MQEPPSHSESPSSGESPSPDESPSPGESPPPSLSSIVKRPRVLAVAAILVVLIVVLIAACGGSGDDEAGAGDTASVESVDTTEDFVPEPEPPVEVTPEPVEPAETVVAAEDLPIVKVKGKALKRGSEGKRVKQLQGALIYLCYLEDGADDGNFGQKTKKSVQAFQLELGLKGDGVAGQKTIRAVNKQVKAGPVTCEATAVGTDAGDAGDGNGNGNGSGDGGTETDPS